VNIGIPKELYLGEQRVAIIPSVVPRLTAAGFTIMIEEGSGLLSGFADQDYRDKGTVVVSGRKTVFHQSDYILQVHALNPAGKIDEEDLALTHPGQILIGLLNPLGSPDVAQSLADHKVTAFALELVPRIARAQSMDVLSSMASIAGYKAVILAADHLSRMFPLLMTAGGTLLPARVFIIGAGVAGLQAIATARRLGAVVHAWDIRPAVKEQVESLGAKFAEAPVEARDAETASGYARAMDESFYRRQREWMTKLILESHVLVTSAAVFGGKAPILITEDMVRQMSPGAVIVDLAGEQGGNCELTRFGKTVSKNGVTIMAPANLATTVPYHASQMYANNTANFILHLTDNGKTLPSNFNLDDQIIRETMITREGQVVNPTVSMMLNKTGSSPDQ